jgi:hypothetical protein
MPVISGSHWICLDLLVYCIQSGLDTFFAAESCTFYPQFLGGTNMLTGHTDEHWKAVRKAVAPAFSAGNMRCVPFQARILWIRV